MKSKTRLIASFCYYTGLHKLAYYLNRNRKRILTFHNVLSDDVYINCVANGVSHSFSSFKTIIEEVGKYFVFSLDFADKRSVTITFDDGYTNQIDVAGKFLKSKGIQAYLFICGQLLEQECHSGGKTNALAIDLLLHWVSFVPTGNYVLSFRDNILKLSITNENRQQIWQQYIWPIYLLDRASKGSDLLNALNLCYKIEDILATLPESYKIERLSGCKIKDLNNLSDAGWKIGWHTYSHYPLKFLNVSEKIAELTPTQNKIFCEIMSYPYGGINEVDDESMDIVKELGYDAALSNIMTPNCDMGKWFIPRMSLSSDKIMLHFELSGLKYLLKNFRLLPKISV